MKKNKKYIIYIINIIIIISIFLLVLYSNKIYPLGNKLLGKSDAIEMFKPMLYNFITKMKTGTLLNYTFNNGLGAATIFDFIYDLASPFNIIALLFKDPDWMYLSTILIKLVFGTICMTYYTSKKNNNNYIIIISTLAYIYSSWFIAYYYYLPWLDVFMVFPLFQYGLEQLLDEHKYHIYIFTLSYMIATNLYLCFTVCIYTIIYFIIYEIIYKKDTKKNKLITFDYLALSSLISGLLAFFYLYCWYDSMMKIKLGFNQSISESYTVSIIDFLKSFYYGNISFVTKMKDKTFPNIACISIILINYIYYFINNKNKRNKTFILIITILCILIIFIPQLDFIMNAFHNIRGLTYRYSYIMSFLMIILFINNTKNLKELNKKHIIISIFILLLGLLLLNKNIPKEFLILNTTFILCYLILIILYNNNKYHKLLIVFIVILQTYTITNIYFYQELNREIPKNIVYKKENNKYRINNIFEKERKYASTYNTYYNNKTTFIYSSMAYSKIIYLLRDLGNITFDNTFADMYDENKIPSLLFNVKSKENDYYLEKVYAVNKNIKETIILDYDVKYSQESIIKNMTNIDNIFDKKTIKGHLENKKYVFDIKEDYYYIKDGDIVYAETSSKIQSDKKEDTLNIYLVNDNKLKEIYDYLSKNQIKYSYYNDNHIKGTINVDKNQLIFTSIPYDKDWEVLVDGKKVEPIELLDSLLGIETTEGKHTIELTYKTHYLIPALISIATLIGLIIDIIKKKNKLKTTRK